MRKIVLRVVTSLIVIIMGLYYSGYRLKSEDLLVEMIDELSINVIDDPMIIYDENNIRSYLLEEDSNFVIFTVIRKGILWKFPSNVPGFYSDNFGETTSSLMVKEKESLPHVLLFYRDMFKYNQEIYDNIIDTVYLSGADKSYAFVYNNEKYDKVELDRSKNHFRLKSQLPCYIGSYDDYEPLFNVNNLFTENISKVNVCIEDCVDYSMSFSEIENITTYSYDYLAKWPDIKADLILKFYTDTEDVLEFIIGDNMGYIRYTNNLDGESRLSAIPLEILRDKISSFKEVLMRG